MNYGERLKKLRESKKLSQQQLAEKLNINRSTYARYELGQTQPDFETLEKLADFFEVSTDYLLGRTDEKTVKVNVAGKEIELTEKEFNVFKELKKYQLAFHDLQSDPEKKVKQLIKMWEVIKMELDEIEDEDKDN